MLLAVKCIALCAALLLCSNVVWTHDARFLGRSLRFWCGAGVTHVKRRCALLEWIWSTTVFKKNKQQTNKCSLLVTTEVWEPLLHQTKETVTSLGFLLLSCTKIKYTQKDEAAESSWQFQCWAADVSQGALSVTYPAEPLNRFTLNKHIICATCAGYCDLKRNIRAANVKTLLLFDGPHLSHLRTKCCINKVFIHIFIYLYLVDLWFAGACWVDFCPTCSRPALMSRARGAGWLSHWSPQERLHRLHGPVHDGKTPTCQWMGLQLGNLFSGAVWCSAEQVVLQYKTDTPGFHRTQVW